MTQRSEEIDRDVAPLRRRVLLEAGLVALLIAASAVLSVRFDGPGRVAEWASSTGAPLSHVVLLLAISHLFMMVFGQRRAVELKREFSRRRQVEAELLHRARHDSLTGLLNRAAFLEQTEAAFAAARAERRQIALALIDLDRFKEVNDTLGHHIGDALLCSVAERLSTVVGATGQLARLGGDEFAVLLPACDAERASAVASGLLAAVQRPFDADGLVLEVDASFGVALGPQHAGSARDLLQHADAAMYEAKADHSGVVLYSPALRARDADHPSLFGDLRRGIASGELQVHYQPKVCVGQRRVLGVEALVRWQHPTRGLLLPADFIPIAEQSGLIRALTDVVLDQALRDCRTWREAGSDLSVAVNLSARSLVDAALPGRVAVLLHEHGLPPACLELEVTESAAMQDPGRALRILHNLRDLGVALSVDDYGTGHASLAYLSRLPVNALKIDRSFVQALDAGSSNHTIVRSTIDLAHNLGLRVVAEGIEDHATWQELSALGCDDAQGYWLARPAPAEHLLTQISRIHDLLGAPASTSA